MPAAISRAILISTVIGNLSRFIYSREYKDPLGQYSVTRLERLLLIIFFYEEERTAVYLKCNTFPSDLGLVTAPTKPTTFG